VVLCFYFHPWEFVEMPTEMHYGEGSVVPDYFLVKNCGDYAVEQLGVLMEMLSERGARYMTAAGLAEAWE
jgi:hypothetical protein